MPPVVNFNHTAVKLLSGVDDPKLAHRMSNEGLYGKGIYFSEFTQYSIAYVAGANKILLNKVLPGKVFELIKLQIKYTTFILFSVALSPIMITFLHIKKSMVHNPVHSNFQSL